MDLEHLWAGWRMPYIRAADDKRAQGLPEELTLFEGIEQSDLDDDDTYICWRGETCFALLNAYPYASGHLMVLPKRGVARLDELTSQESTELWSGVNAAVRAIEVAFRPHGINVGMNLGQAAGAGVPDHLHVHVLPRWTADTNFTTTVANARVLPEALVDTWRALRDAWPAD